MNKNWFTLPASVGVTICVSNASTLAFDAGGTFLSPPNTLEKVIMEVKMSCMCFLHRE